MPRYIKDFQVNTDPQSIYFSINQFLQNEGYEYIEYDGESVYKKGQGVLGNPTFFKISYYTNMVRMESWMKYAFFPGVYVGEFGITGFVGSAVKGPWKKRIAYLENMLGNMSTQTSYSSPSSNMGVPSFCTNCGNQIQEGAQFCTVCGNRIQVQNVFSQNNMSQQNFSQQNSFFEQTNTNSVPGNRAISRREYINLYAQPSLRKNITSIAILCYVCAAITFIVSCIVNPLGIIDALLLLALALGMHLAKSKVCAILILILSIFEVVFSLISGSFPFWWLIAGISAVITFHKIDKEYKKYLNDVNRI